MDQPWTEDSVARTLINPTTVSPTPPGGLTFPLYRIALLSIGSASNKDERAQGVGIIAVRSPHSAALCAKPAAYPFRLVNSGRKFSSAPAFRCRAPATRS